MEFPRIISVKAISASKLVARFENGKLREYDCSPLFRLVEFFPLTTEAIFKAVKIDPGGRGLNWSDDIDLSESEIWLNGTPID